MAKKKSPTFSHNGNEYQLSDFSEAVTHLITVREKWREKLAELNLEAGAYAAALRQLEAELQVTIEAETK